MADMDIYEFAAMLEATPITTRVVEYRVPLPDHAGRMQLVAVCLVDILDDGISLVYSFYDPDLRTDSLGIYMILDHITAAQGAALPYVYLGYWVPGSPKMAYKANFAGVEVYAGRIWQPLQNPAAFADLTKSVSIDPVSDQVAQIELPQNKP
jgi:arginine-tRNA-protein transferase